MPYDVVFYVTNDMYGNEWTRESVSRFMTLMGLWRQSHGFKLIIPGGLKNRHGISIAQSILERLHRFNFPDEEILRPLDETSVDTWTQMQSVVEIFNLYLDGVDKEKDMPRFFVVSDRFHLVNIIRMGKTLGIKIYPKVSPLSGNIVFKSRRLSKEILRFFWSIFDPRYQSSAILKRRERFLLEAKQKG